MASIEDFKNALAGGGARANHFKIEITGRNGLGLGSSDYLLVKTTTLPGSDTQPIQVPFRGRSINVAGEQAFQPWSFAVLNDTNFKIRRAVETWMSEIQQYRTTTGAVNPSLYKANAKVYQLGRDDSVLYTYEMFGIFPISISPIQVDYQATNIEEFDITFALDYFGPQGIA